MTFFFITNINYTTMNKSIIFFASLLLGSAAASAQMTCVVAHRGYWDVEGSAQNSIRALVKADSIDCYGSEFDVWMTADKKLVVNHDADINGVHIETSKARDVLAQKLKNGENVPTLEQYLDRALSLRTRLILELKPHADKKLEEVTQYLETKMRKLEDKVDANKDAQQSINAQQMAYNAAANANIDVLKSQVASLTSVTKLFIPSSNVCQTGCGCGCNA